MANFTAKAEAIVTMNGKDAEAVLNTLKEKAKDLRKQITEIKKTDPNNPNLKKMEKDLKSIESSAAKVKQTTFEYGKVLKNLNGSNLKDLQKTKQILLGQIKSMTQGTREYIEKAKQLRQVDTQIGKINKSIKEQQSAVGRVADGFTKWFGTFATVTASVAGLNAVVRRLTGYFKDWEKTFTNVLTLMSDTDIEMYGKSMEKGAIDVMRRYGLTIEDTNKALFDAVSAGIPAADSIRFLNEAAKLAIGGVTSLSVAVDGMTSIIKAYSLSTEDTNKVTSAFFTAQKYGKTTVADLASGIGKIAPIARTAGLSFQEVLSAIAELTLRGVRTDEAITALRGAISALVDPGKEAAKILAEFNVPMGMTGIRAAGLGKTLQALNKVIEENPDLIAKAIPNVRGFTAVTALSGEAIEHYDRILQDVNNDFGETSYLTKAVAMQQETLAQRMARAKAEFVAYVLESDKLRDILSKLIFSTNKFIKLLLSIPSEVYMSAAAFMALAAALKSYNALIRIGHTLMVGYNKILLLGMTGFYRLTGNIQKATIAWRAFNIGFSKTAIGAVIVTVAALIAGLTALFKSTNRATKAYKEFQVEFEKEKRNVTGLFEAYKKTNEETDARKQILEKIKTKYGEYIKDLINEKGELTDIEAAYNRINTSLQEQIALKIKNAAGDDITSKFVEDYVDYMEQIRKGISKQKGDDAADIHIAQIKSILDEYKNDVDYAMDEVYKYLQENSISWSGKVGGFFNVEQISTVLGNARNLMKEFNDNMSGLEKKFSGIFTQKGSTDSLGPFLPAAGTEMLINGVLMVFDGKIWKKKRTENTVKPEEEPKEQKQRLAALENNLEQEHQLRLQAIEKARKDENQTEALYNLRLAQEDEETYNARISAYQEFIKTISDATVKSDVQKKTSENQTKLLQAERKTEEQELKLYEDDRKRSLDTLQKKYDAQKAMLDVSKASGQITEEQYSLLMLALDKGTADTRLEIEKQYLGDVNEAIIENGQIKAAAVETAEKAVQDAQTAAANASFKLLQTQLKTERDFKRQYNLLTAEEEKTIQLKLLEDIYNARKKFLEKSGYDTKELTKAYAQAKANIELSSEQESIRLRQELGVTTWQEDYETEMTRLDNLLKNEKISQEDYEKAVFNQKVAYLKKYFDYYSGLFSNMINSLQDAEVSRVEADEQKKLAALQDRRDRGLIAEDEYNAEKEKIEHEAAQKKLDIEKKYADVNFAIKVSDIIANTSVAIMTAFSQLGPVGGAIAAVMLGITGTMQIAAANAERQKVKAMTLDSASSGGSTTQQRVVLPGIEEGGYTEAEREQDGKIFSAKKRKRRGYADEPTVLIGEAGAEFVANADAVNNPTIRPVLDLINIAQQNGSISSINLPKLVNSMYAVRGYESGGYTSTPSAAPSPPAVSSDEAVAVMKDVRDLLNYLKTNGVDAWVVLSQLQKQQATLEKSEALGSRK
ncbi:MAG: phage tail tape measure protein [Prevotellaceae bacterium]|jgi:TP901 family phage tail tape measure protein|nr:phage tail tape measure protein [Prevotellaceae bacterium]